MDRYALVSVWNKEGLLPFVKGLRAAGLKILSTGGTFSYLQKEGVEVRSISDYTGFPEILDGRVKTLHPLVHGGILARRDRADDLQALKDNGVSLIDFVVVNLYPFPEKVREIEAAKNPNHESLIEYIDIGGPTMIRAAAKNWQHMTVVSNPAQYETVLGELQKGEISLTTRRGLAAEVFKTMSAYDGAVAKYLALEEKLLDDKGAPRLMAPVESIVMQERQTLRYGENPHQEAKLYAPVTLLPEEAPMWEQLQGKELSYNNLLDTQAAVDLFLELRAVTVGQEVAVVIKHNNPCGAAARATQLEAFQAARDCDPVSAFGGIVVVSGSLNKETAETMGEGFLEVVVAEAVDADAATVLRAKKNVRVLKVDFARLQAFNAKQQLSVRPFFDSYLVQSGDKELAPIAEAQVVVGKADAQTLNDLRFAWAICKHVKSNAIIIVKNNQAIGIGAGQMSRVDSARLAVQRAEIHGHSVQDSVAASDAFLPFPDTLEQLNDAGVTALVQPGGSMRDDAVVDAAKQRSMVMAVTGERHFRH